MLQNGTVLGVTAGKIPDLSILQQPDPLREFLNEVAVVGHKQQRSLEFLNGRLHPFSGRDVQMVGGFVQNQQIDFFIHQHAQPQPGLFAAGQVTNLLKDILSLEHKRAQPVPGHLGRAVFFIEHGVVKGSFRMVKMDNLR